jgi:hypothetical protein
MHAAGRVPANSDTLANRQRLDSRPDRDNPTDHFMSENGGVL